MFSDGLFPEDFAEEVYGHSCPYCGGSVVRHGLNKVLCPECGTTEPYSARLDDFADDEREGGSGEDSLT